MVNGVECEPGITIDQAVLRDDSELVTAGVRALADALGTDDIVLAVERDKKLLRAVADRYPFRLLPMPRHYPAGAEKLIVRRLRRRALAPGELPAHAGVLVHNVASLRALGVALSEGTPVIDRPLSVVCPSQGIFRNVVVPLGVEISSVLTDCGVASAVLGEPVLFSVVAGAVAFSAVFIAGDPKSSPVSKGGQWAAGCIAGVTNAVIRKYTFYSEGIVFSFLLANLLSPTLDRAAFFLRARILLRRRSAFEERLRAAPGDVG